MSNADGNVRVCKGSGEKRRSVQCELGAGLSGPYFYRKIKSFLPYMCVYCL